MDSQNLQNMKSANNGSVRMRFDNLDGLRAISCLVIIGYHVKKWTDMPLGGIGGRIVSTLTQFVPLFLILSGFGMFCGYYERIKNNQISLNDFYKKRYQKLFPYMAFVLLIYVLIERSIPGTIEALTESTLVFGLLPNNNLNVLAIGWTVGVIFLFYMLFPFIVFTCWTKRRAWVTLGISIVLSLFCSEYFFSENFVINFVQRHSFLYCSPFFIVGGVMCLYKDQIRSFVSKHRWPSFIICVVLSIVFCFCPSSLLGISITMLKGLLMFVPWVCYSISTIIMGDDSHRIDQSGGLNPDSAGVEPAPILLRRCKDNVIRLHILMFGGGPAIRAKTYRVFHKHNTQVVLDEIVKWATEGVSQLGCSPCTLAVGVGRSHFEATSMMLQAQVDGRYDVQSEMEQEITRRVNESNIGPLGLRGDTSVIATFMKVGPQRASGVKIVCVRPACCFEPRNATVELGD